METLSNYFSFHYNFSPIVNIPLDCVRMRWDEMIHKIQWNDEMIHKILASLKQWDIPFHWEHISMTEHYRCFQIYTVLCRVILGLILQLPCWIHFIIFQHFIVYCIFGRHFSSLEQNIYLFQIKFSKFANSSIHSEVLQMVHG